MGAALRFSSAGETVGVGAVVCVVVGGWVAVAAGGGVTLGAKVAPDALTVADPAAGWQAISRKARKTAKVTRIIHFIICGFQDDRAMVFASQRSLSQCPLSGLAQG